jgi:tetratricopeptide (TPR) repeat protein
MNLRSAMSRILFRVFAAALVAGFALGPACAQAPQGPEQKWVAPPDNVPKPRPADRTRNIDFLFDALKVAPDEESAKGVENRIWALWMHSGSDTADLLMARSKLAMTAKDYDLAIRLLIGILEIRPDFTEAWNRRATLFFLKKDYANALADLRMVVAREPRHFAALAGLGTIMEELGDDKQALEAFRRAQAINPHLKGMSDQVKSLSEKVEGRDI